MPEGYAGAHGKESITGIRERTITRLAARRGKPGGGGGRKPVLTPRKMEQARKLLDAGERPRDVAELVGVSLATLYRRFPASERVFNNPGHGTVSAT